MYGMDRVGWMAKRRCLQPDTHNLRIWREVHGWVHGEQCCGRRWGNADAAWAVCLRSGAGVGVVYW